MQTVFSVIYIIFNGNVTFELTELAAYT